MSTHYPLCEFEVEYYKPIFSCVFGVQTTHAGPSPSSANRCHCCVAKAGEANEVLRSLVQKI